MVSVAQSGIVCRHAITRYEAFHSAQLAALAHARQNHGSGHPFYWAGVVYVGDPSDLPTNGQATLEETRTAPR
jgi:hypothetical protein